MEAECTYEKKQNGKQSKNTFSESHRSAEGAYLSKVRAPRVVRLQLPWPLTLVTPARVDRSWESYNMWRTACWQPQISLASSLKGGSTRNIGNKAFPFRKTKLSVYWWEVSIFNSNVSTPAKTSFLLVFIFNSLLCFHIIGNSLQRYLCPPTSTISSFWTSCLCLLFGWAHTKSIICNSLFSKTCEKFSVAGDWMKAAPKTLQLLCQPKGVAPKTEPLNTLSCIMTSPH